MIRSIVAVVAGYMILSLLAIGTALLLNLFLPGIIKFPPPRVEYALLNLIYIALFSVVAGYATAALAPRAPFGHAVVFALLLLTFGAAFNFAEMRGDGRLWYPLTIAAIECAAAILGGYLRARRAKTNRQLAA